MNTKRFFISYAHGARDQAICARFAEALTRAGHHVFSDQRLRFGDAWSEEIERQICACDYFLLVLSPKALESEMVLQEVERACARRKAEGTPVLLTVRVKVDGDLPLRWGAHLSSFQDQRWRGQRDFDQIFQAILDSIEGKPDLTPPDEPEWRWPGVLGLGAAAVFLLSAVAVACRVKADTPCLLVPDYVMQTVTSSEGLLSRIDGDGACDPRHFFCVELPHAGRFPLPPNGVRIGSGPWTASGGVHPAGAPDASQAFDPARLELPLPRWVQGTASLCDDSPVLLKRTAPDGGFAPCAGGAFRCELMDGVRRCDISDDGC